MMVLCNSLLLILHLFNGKEQGLSHSSFFLRLYAVKDDSMDKAIVKKRKKH